MTALPSNNQSFALNTSNHSAYPSYLRPTLLSKKPNAFAFSPYPPRTQVEQRHHVCRNDKRKWPEDPTFESRKFHCPFRLLRTIAKHLRDASFDTFEASEVETIRSVEFRELVDRHTFLRHARQWRSERMHPRTRTNAPRPFVSRKGKDFVTKNGTNCDSQKNVSGPGRNFIEIIKAATERITREGTTLPLPPPLSPDENEASSRCLTVEISTIESINRQSITFVF